MFGRMIQYNDVCKAQIYNEAIKLQERARAILKPKDFIKIFGDLDDPGNPNPFKDKRLLNLTIIQPESVLPANGLEFDPVQMAEMMAMGAEAVHRRQSDNARAFISPGMEQNGSGNHSATAESQRVRKAS